MVDLLIYGLTLVLGIIGINLLLTGSFGLSWFEAVLMNLLILYWVLLWIVIYDSLVLEEE